MAYGHRYSHDVFFREDLIRVLSQIEQHLAVMAKPAYEAAERAAEDKYQARIQARREFESTGLSAGAINCLTFHGYTSVDQVKQASDYELLRMRNCGPKRLHEIRSSLS